MRSGVGNIMLHNVEAVEADAGIGKRQCSSLEAKERERANNTTQNPPVLTEGTRLLPLSELFINVSLYSYNQNTTPWAQHNVNPSNHALPKPTNSCGPKFPVPYGIHFC